MLRTQMAILRRLAKCEPADTIAVGREIAARVIEAGRYAL
jgi:butyryl-CoA dehydrogenase